MKFLKSSLYFVLLFTLAVGCGPKNKPSETTMNQETTTTTVQPPPPPPPVVTQTPPAPEEIKQFVEAVKKGDTPVVENLLKTKTNPELVAAKDSNGFSVLLLVPAENGEKIAEMLINAGADVKAKAAKANEDLLIIKGHTPLHLFSAAGYINAAKLSLEKGADVNAKNDDGYTPLLLAVTNNKKDMTQLLLNKGADVNAKDVSGSTPLYWANTMNYTEVAEYLKQKGGKE